MTPQYGELRPTNGWDLLASLRYPSKFQRVSRLGFVTAGCSDVAQRKWTKLYTMFGRLLDWYTIYRTYTVSGKNGTTIFASDFAKCWPIFKILSLADLAVNFWQCCCEISHHTSNASLHYLVKYWCQKNREPEVYHVIHDISQGIIAVGFRSGKTPNRKYGKNWGFSPRAVHRINRPRRNLALIVYRGSAIAYQIWPSSVKGGRYSSLQNVNICQKLLFGHRQLTQWTHSDEI